MLWTNQRQKGAEFVHMDRKFINFYSIQLFSPLVQSGNAVWVLKVFSVNLLYKLVWLPLRETKKTKPQTNKNALAQIFKSNVKLMLERDSFGQLAFWMPPEHCIDVSQAAFKKLSQKRSHLVEKMNMCRIIIFDLNFFTKFSMRR